MEIVIKRSVFNTSSTLGKVYVNGNLFGYCLEDVYRGDIGANPALKVPGATAIPEGRYLVAVTPSARFKRDLPELHNVPGFTKIRIHGGNTHEDTEGCILIGDNSDMAGRIWNCKRAVNVLTEMIKKTVTNCYITVTRE